MRHLTVRHVPADLAEALQREKARRNTSLNRTIIDLLRQVLGVGIEEPRNGLERFAGTWTSEDLQSFEDATALFEEVDDDLWK
jgi:hypothetical protein